MNEGSRRENQGDHASSQVFSSLCIWSGHYARFLHRYPFLGYRLHAHFMQVESFQRHLSQRGRCFIKSEIHSCLLPHPHKEYRLGADDRRLWEWLDVLRLNYELASDDFLDGILCYMDYKSKQSRSYKIGMKTVLQRCNLLATPGLMTVSSA